MRRTGDRQQGSMVGDPHVRRLVAAGDPGTEPGWSVSNDRRYAAYSGTRLRFRPDVIRDLRPGDVMVEFIRPRRGAPLWVAITRAEFDATFAHVVTTDSWLIDGDYNYSSFPQKAEQFIVVP